MSLSRREFLIKLGLGTAVALANPIGTAKQAYAMGCRPSNLPVLSLEEKMQIAKEKGFSLTDIVTKYCNDYFYPADPTDSKKEKEEKESKRKEKLTRVQYFEDNWELCNDLDEITLLPGGTFYSLYGTESDFNQSCVSDAQAFSIAQLMPSSVDELNRIYKDRFKPIIEDFFDVEKLKDLKFEDYKDSLESNDFSKFGFSREKYLSSWWFNNGNVYPDEVLYVILPAYIKFKEILGDKWDENNQVDESKIKADKDYAAYCGAAHFLSYYLHMSALQWIVTGKDDEGKKKGKWIYRPRSHFDKNPQTQAFDFLDVVAAYNKGLGQIKKDYAKLAKDDKYMALWANVQETNIHRGRFREYQQIYNIIQKALSDFVADPSTHD